jgi:hypothetical protein
MATKDIYIKVKNVPDDIDIIEELDVEKWTRRGWEQVEYEEIDLPALLERQRHICGGVYLKSDTHDHRDEGYTNADIHDDIINAPSSLDIDYKTRSVDYNTEEK